MDIVVILLGLLVGFILLVKGADVMVTSAVQIAVKLKIPQSIIGATFIAVSYTHLTLPTILRV